MSLRDQVHRVLRGEKVELLLNNLDDCLCATLLDVGASFGMAGEFKPLYQKFNTRVAVNLDVQVIPGALRLIADGKQLPFADHCFDCVFSNAVIEHVGTWEEQMRFAAELRRVCRHSYFVTTPNRYFPIEPHAMLPFYQFYPEWLKAPSLKFSRGYLQTPDRRIRLLNAKEMKALFPEATIGTTGFHSSLYALGKSPAVERGQRGC